MLRGFALYARLPQLSIIQRVYKFVKILSERCVLCKQTQLRKSRRVHAQDNSYFSEYARPQEGGTNVSYQRWLGVFLMAVAIASPAFVAGCAEHATVLVYDPYYGDDHVWNDNEVVFYRRWAVQTHRPYREFRALPPAEQREYRNWRDHHPSHH
jgi:hypothetical protein